MTEILTESFCERCGTRYTFESARPKTRLKSVKVLSRGLKNFVLSDDTSMDEAMAAARSETDREASAHQLDAFHKTFSFCMSCRQYTCPNCWNDAEARCLSCAPLALPEPPALAETAPFLVGDAIGVDAETAAPVSEAPSHTEPFDDLRALRDALLRPDEVEAEPTNGAYLEADEATGAQDVTADEEQVGTDLAAEGDGAAEDAALAEAGSLREATPETPDEVAEIVAASAAQPAEDDAAGKAASQTLGLLRRFRPGQSLDAELAAFERERDETVVTGDESATDDLVVAETPALEPSDASIEAAAEPAIDAGPPDQEAAEVAAEVAAELPAQPESTPAEPEPAPIAAAAIDDVVEQPTWRITAPDPTTTVPPSTSPEAGGQVPLQASASPQPLPKGEPQWPARPEWPSSTPAAGLPYLGRPATPQGGVDALWAASNQEIVSAPQPVGKAAASSIQPCVSCGLSLSATARFCRRCGTLQGR